MKSVKKLPVLLIAVAAISLIPGSSNRNTAIASETPGAGEAPMAMPVITSTIESENIQIWKKFSGHIVAVDRAEIRPQVSGIITEVKFEDGQHVEKDDILIVIDPRPYQATLDQAEAALQAARTSADLAEKEYQRAKKLIETDAIAKSVLDERINNRHAAAAAVSGAEALVNSAKINLDYAHIKAPISGTISRAEITVGNLVQSGPGAPLLTSIISDDKVYADFEVDEATYINSVASKQSKEKTPVRIQLRNGVSEYEGYIQSFDNRIDPASGTIRARAVFDNKEGHLLPGMSVTVQMGEAGQNEKIMVSERAIGTDQDRKFVYVINGEGLSEYREIRIGDSVNGKRVVLKGLKAGETVISEGIVRIRPGMPVVPKSALPANTEEKSSEQKAEAQH